MRKFIYNSLVGRLKQISNANGEPIIKSFDIWNNNIQHLNIGQVFELPAVFIEFAPFNWSHQGGGVRDTVATIRLHVLQQVNAQSLDERGYTDRCLTRFDLLASINVALHGYSRSSDYFAFGALTSTLSTTDNNYGKVATDIEEYQCRCNDSSLLSSQDNNAVWQPSITIKN